MTSQPPTLTPDDIRRARAIALSGIERVRQITDEVAEASGISRRMILGPRRNSATARARHLIMFIAAGEGITDATIAIALNCDRSTVAKGLQAEAARRKGETHTSQHTGEAG